MGATFLLCSLFTLHLRWLGGIFECPFCHSTNHLSSGLRSAAFLGAHPSILRVHGYLLQWAFFRSGSSGSQGGCRMLGICCLERKKNMHIIFGVLAMLRLSSTRTEIVQNFPRMRQKTGSFFCRGRKCLSNRRTDFRTALHLPNTTSSYTQSGREDSTVRRCGDGHQLRWL